VTLNIKANDIVSFVFTLLYLLSSIETIMVLFPNLMRAKIASNHLIDLKSELEKANLEQFIPKKHIFKNEFNQITIRGLEFYYEGVDKCFSIGPINFDIQKGEIIFIYGGNGSGKTTFIHSILGIYPSTSGEIKLNGVLINNDNYPEYRTIFSVVFSDFYLFNELIGIDNLDIKKWNHYIQLFELEGKVKMEGKCFSTTDLSKGQQKRLALIASLLEEKPVLVIDEWAADQDPHFRKKFYTEIIPLLKKEGIAIIAITHDDKYYHCADKIYKMDYGKLTEEDVKEYESSLMI
jgi:putative ATP-binding cassette transporter